jgi:hypothetical protein
MPKQRQRKTASRTFPRRTSSGYIVQHPWELEHVPHEQGEDPQEHLTIAAAARRIGCPESTVRSRLRRDAPEFGPRKVRAGRRNVIKRVLSESDVQLLVKKLRRTAS